MADLEERFLQKNVPGRYSSWNDYDEHDRRVEADDDTGGGGESDHDGDACCATAPPPVPPPASAPTFKGRLPKSSNTGLGAVAADYRAAREEGARRAAVERCEEHAAWDRAVNGARMKTGEGSLSLAARNTSQNRRQGNDRDDADDGSESDEEDDGFLEEYRAKRLEQLRQSAAASSNSAPSLPAYGTVTEVTKFEFADAVDSTDPRTLLAVHMYEPSVRSCASLNHILDDLAQTTLTHVRFLRLRASDAGLNLDPLGLPSLALYRGGELEHNLTPVTERLPRDFNVEDVRRLLVEECGAGPPTGSEKGGAPPHQRPGVGGGPMLRAQPVALVDDYDSDDADLDELCRDFEPSLR